MDKKICELKLNELQAVVGGIAFSTTVTASASKVPASTTWNQPIDQRSVIARRY